MGCVASDETTQSTNRQLEQDSLKEGKKLKLLLLGTGNSGKSTFFKQLLALHGNSMTSDVNQYIRTIHDSMLSQMRAIVEACIEAEGKLSGEGEKSMEYMQESSSDSALTKELASAVKTLWMEPAIKAAFDNRSNLGIVDSCPHFFNNIDRISEKDYVPTEEDILLTRVPTTGIQEASFAIKNHIFTIYDVGGQRNERSKWIHCFDKVSAILFVASLSCYDQNLYEDNIVNAMHEALELFKEISNLRYFRLASIILFLNKSDLFREKLKSKSLNVCFKDYTGDNFNSNAFDHGVMFIKNKFKSQAYTRIANNNGGHDDDDDDDQNDQKYPSNNNNNVVSHRQSIAINEDQAIYTHVTCATDRNNVQKVFENVQHFIVMKALGKSGLI